MCVLPQAFTVPLFSALQDSARLAQPTAFAPEFIGRGGVEFEHIEVAGDDQFGRDVLGQLRGLVSK
jgi:hypothetical protein